MQSVLTNRPEFLAKLFKGDCLEIMKDIPDDSVNLILCDPPYGTTACKWDSVIPFEPLWKEYERIATDDAAIVLFASQPFTSSLVMSKPDLFKYSWVWDKVKPSSALHAKFQPLRKHEDILVFSKTRPKYFPQMEEAKPRTFKDKVYNNGEAFGDAAVARSFDNKGLKYPKSILTISNADQRGRVHPTQKPVPLMEYLVKTYTNEGDVVLDNTMGSGSTGVACKNTGRNFIGIEMDQGYFEIAKLRIESA